jgi:hypothetical protein
MASVATSSISNVTPQVTNQLARNWSMAGVPVEIWRIASGQASADTAVIKPATFNDIQSVMTSIGASHNLTTNQNTSVTLTIQSGSVTVGAFEVWIVGKSGA